MFDENLPLYVKYRPRKYDQFIQGVRGQPISRLVAQETANLYPPCMIVEGDYGSGKTSVARVRLARRNCHRWSEHPYEPCGECLGCISGFGGGGGFDIAGVEIRANEPEWYDHLEYYLKATRDTRPWPWSGNAALPPVIIIDEFWRATPAQQVSLLQELEAGQYAFILLTSKEGSIDGGILSRSLTMRFTAPSRTAFASWLTSILQAEHLTAEAGVAELLLTGLQFRPREVLTAVQELALGRTTLTTQATREYLQLGPADPSSPPGQRFGGLS